MAGSQIHLHPKKSLGGLGIPSVYEKSETKLRKYPKSSPAVQGFSGISWQTAPVAAPSHPRCPRPAFQPLFRFCLGREWSTVVHTWSTPLARRLTTADGPSTLHAKHNPATANAAHKSTCITVINTPNTIAGKTATESVCRIKQNTNSQCCQFLSACLFPLSPIPMLLFKTTFSSLFYHIFLSLTVNATERICFHCNCIPQSA